MIKDINLQIPEVKTETGRGIRIKGGGEKGLAVLSGRGKPVRKLSLWIQAKSRAL